MNYKNLFFLIIIWVWIPGNGQNVGVGTTSPQAPFHLKSLSAIEMLRIEGLNPYISFFNGPDYSGYLWYNTNKMELGTPMGSGESVLIAPGRVATAYFTTTGRLGLGTAAPTEKLDVLGNLNLTGLLKIDGNSGLTGQALVSNGAGSPIWQTLSLNPQTAFLAENGSGQTIPALTQTKLTFPTESFDDGSDFNTISHTYVVPASGVYHFDTQVTYYEAAPGSYRLFLDNNTSILDGEYARSYYAITGTAESITLSISITLKLTAGASVLVHTWHTGSADMTTGWAYFSAHRVY